MNYQTLLNQLEHHTEENNHYFKKIHNVLYFNDETFLHNPDFLNENNNREKTYTIEIKNLEKKRINVIKNIPNNFKRFSKFINNYFEINKYNLCDKNESLIKCILNILDYKMVNGKNELFKKMLRENDAINLFNKFNFQKRKICKKKVLRNLLINQDEDNEIIIKFLCDYLNINLLILENNKYNLYSNNDEFELYKVTLVLYKYDDQYYTLSEKKTNKKLFTSEDNINYRIKYNLLIQNHNFQKPIVQQLENVFELTNQINNLNLEESPEEIIEEIIDLPIINYNKMKVTELKKLCKERKIKGYSKLKKKELIEILKK
tara:strand:- start:1617 stop:2570 length:954 start_codon:yes stop_codon:yes gene_type:complete